MERLRRLAPGRRSRPASNAGGEAAEYCGQQDQRGAEHGHDREHDAQRHATERWTRPKAAIAQPALRTRGAIIAGILTSRERFLNRSPRSRIAGWYTQRAFGCRRPAGGHRSTDGIGEGNSCRETASRGRGAARRATGRASRRRPTRTRERGPGGRNRAGLSGANQNSRPVGLRHRPVHPFPREAARVTTAAAGTSTTTRPTGTWTTVALTSITTTSAAPVRPRPPSRRTGQAAMASGHAGPGIAPAAARSGLRGGRSSAVTRSCQPAARSPSP